MGSENMIAIVDIKTEECKGDHVDIMEFDNAPTYIRPSFSPLEFRNDASCSVERIIADRYRYPDGREVKIGMSRKVQEVLGLPLRCMSNMSGTIDSLYRSNNKLANELHSWEAKCAEYRDAKFLRRLKYLFKGVL